MNKEEILKYVSENYNLPEDAMKYIDDIEFFIQILKIESSIMYDLPMELQKSILLVDDRYLEESDIEKLFEDKKFAKELVDKNNDIILSLRGISIDNEYIRNLTISYIKGEQVPVKGSKLEKSNPRRIYVSSTKEIREDHELALYLIEQNINYLPDIKDKTISDNPQYIVEYVKKNPHKFSKYLDKISDNLTPDVIKSVLKYDFQSYKLIDKNNTTMKLFYESIDRIKQIRPELKMDNPNLRYELLCDSEFIDMDINIVNSLLEYNTGNVDKIIEIKDNGRLNYLTRYIEQYNSLYGNNLENIQNAISSFESLEQLLVNTNNFDGIPIDETKIKTIIATGNKFEINTEEKLLNYDEIVKEYYRNKLNQATNLDEIREIYAEMLFNTSKKGLEKFNEEYCNFNIEELCDYAKRKEVESPISKELEKRLELYNKLNNIKDMQELKEYFNKMPLEVCDIEETKKKIASMYSKSYNNQMINLADETLEHQNYQGVDLIRLNGQNFNICIHRIFNFDFNMNSITNEIISNPEQWNLTEGSNTISTTLITDKKIAALFRPLQKSKATPLICLDSKEAEEEYKRKTIEEARQIYEGKRLKPIDENAVFYGFTEGFENGIIKMDSTDMMVEHGKGHLETNISHCRMRDVEDLAYWTKPDYWNEIVQKRKETDIDKVDKLREENGTDRAKPTCIVCFDGQINEKSMLAARTHNIPILMIDRQQYLDINYQKLEMARKDFTQSLSIESMREIFYRQPYYKVVEEMPNLIETINNNKVISMNDKKVSLEYLAYLGQHFIEQSSGYIIDIPVEEYNKKMQQCIQSIDMELQCKDLVTMNDMKSAYIEVSALDRKKRYEALKSDIRQINSKESEIEYE